MVDYSISISSGNIVEISSLTGPQGATGSTGATGPQGIQGVQGDPGLDAQLFSRYQSSANISRTNGLITSIIYTDIDIRKKFTYDSESKITVLSIYDGRSGNDFTNNYNFNYTDDDHVSTTFSQDSGNTTGL